MPSKFENILPNYQRLEKVHLHSYYFVEEQNDSISNLNTLIIELKQKSVFKIQILPKNTNLNLSIKTNLENPILEIQKDIPYIYTSFSTNGEIEIKFSMLFSENGSDRTNDEICNSPYILMEIYFESESKFNERIGNIKKELKKHNEMQNQINGFFTLSEDKDAYPISTQLTPYKITLNEMKSFKQYEISVINEYDLNIPSSFENVNKIYLNLQVFADFFLFGSFNIILIRKDDLEGLYGLNCLYDGKCITADRPSKNLHILQTVLTPGEYKILFVYNDDISILKKKINSIPISAKIKLKQFEKPSNVFNCEGRRLPNNFDYLMNKKDEYFEYKGDIIMNLEKLNDIIEFEVFEESLLRVSIAHEFGSSIAIELYRQDEKIVTTSERTVSIGDVDGLLSSLNPGRYKLIFNYKNSFFTENKRKRCEKMKVKIGISKISSYAKKVFNNCEEISNYEEYFSSAFNKGMIESKILFTNYDKSNDIIYSKLFELNGSFSIYAEIVSDFISSNIIPIIIPVTKTNTPLNKDIFSLKNVNYFDNRINMKLPKGKYYFILANGITQYNYGIKNFDFKLPICLSFQVRINSILLDNKKKHNWECNDTEYDLLPSILNKDEKNKFTYFSKYVMIPEEKAIIKFKFSSDFVLRLNYEHQIKIGKMDVSLNSNGKVLKKAKVLILQEEFVSDQQYLSHTLKANKEYELIFENLNEDSFFDQCRLFKIEINLIAVSSIQKCENTFTPKLEEITYERLIDVSDSYYAYGSKTILQMFSKNILTQSFNNTMDLEVAHPKSTVFVLDSSNKFSTSYQIEVKAALAKLTVIIENPYGSLVGIAAIVTSITDDGNQAIASEDMEDEGIYTLRGILLEIGKYNITFYENQNSKVKGCSVFSATILLENKPFDLMSKAISENYETCPYLYMPENLNLPGWVSEDTNYSINQINRFRIKEGQKNIRFRIKERSIFKFLIPDEHFGLFSYVALYKVAGNKKEKIIEKKEVIENYINIVLTTGTYLIQFSFTGVAESKITIENKCTYFDMYLVITPVSFIKDGIDGGINLCNNSEMNIQPNTYSMNNNLKISSKEGFGVTTANEYRIKLTSSKQNGVFIAELVNNPYLDSTYKIKIYRKEKLNEDEEVKNSLVELEAEYVSHENYIWIQFRTEANTEYYLGLVPYSFDNYSLCSNVVLSYNYEEKTGSLLNVSEEYKKIVCPVTQHIPAKFSYKGNEHNIVSEYLLPQDSVETRTSFIVREDSVLFIKMIPKYKTTSNIFLELYREKNMSYRYAHNEHNGILMYKISGSKTPYFLDITFDKTRENDKCDSYEFLLSIIPKKIYLDEYLSCDTEPENIPTQLTIDKSSQYKYSSYIGFDQKYYNGFISGNKSMIKKILLELKKSTAITLELEYVTSDNYFDIVIEDEEGILEFGNESHYFSQSVNGIITKKLIEVKLKKGNYTIKLIFHNFFKDLIKRLFDYDYDKDYSNICFGFTIDIEAVILSLKQDKEKVKNIDEDDSLSNTSSEITDLNKSDLNNNLTNPLLSVEPGKLNSLKLFKKFSIELLFAFDIETNSDNYLQLAYLENDIRFYPFDYKLLDSDKIRLTFTTNEMMINKCYNFRLNSEIFHELEDDSIEHVYCTIKCDCNRNASYSCTKNNKCKCHHPYTGDKCENCVEGYTLNDGKCLENIKCDSVTTCSGHGKCTGYSDEICKCDEGFTSEDESIYCNICTNPNKVFPYCNERKGQSTKDSIVFNFESDCNEAGISIPENLYFENGYTNIQDVDGSLDLLNIFKISENEEYTQIKVPEESIIRIFFLSREPNRAKIMILYDIRDQDPLAYTDGVDQTESFIAKLDSREEPYIIKFIHSNTKYYQCNRYLIKISIKPISLVNSELKCRKGLDIVNYINILPPNSISIDKDEILLADRIFSIPDVLVLNPQETSRREKLYDYTQVGLASIPRPNEEFVYNIKIDLKNSTFISSSAKYDFLTNDISLVLRDDKSVILKQGEWLIPESGLINVQDYDFINEFSILLGPGVYYLTIIQNIPSNHLLQLFYESSPSLYEKTRHCFEFKLHIQANLIVSPDPKIPLDQFEILYNRIVDVNPENYASIRIDEKFEIFISFEASISSQTRDNKDFTEAFYFENVRNRQKISPAHVYLQGSLSKTFLIIFDENYLGRDECYDLKYDLDILKSDSQKVLISDKLQHRYCTHSCNCNPHTNFKCDTNGQCICDEPYTGNDCYSCISGWIKANYKCISQENCDKNFCNDFGKCENGNEQIPKCICEKEFNGNNDCSACTDTNKIFPNCKDFISESSASIDYNNFNTTDSHNVDLTLDGSDLANQCSHSFVPHDLDMIGYLHLTGQMHISGLYSMKHIGGKHYTTKFTVKQRSHVKVYIEHSKSTHVINIFLIIDNKMKYPGDIHIGPAGLGSVSFIDFYVDPIMDKGEYKSCELNYFIKDLLSDDEIIVSYSDAKKSELESDCFNLYLEMQIEPSSQNTASCNTQKLPQLVPLNIPLFDFHTIFYSMEQVRTKYTYIRENTMDIIYFHHEYFYVPDHLDQELIIEMELFSSFRSNQIGIMLEIVEIPTNLKIDHKKLTAQKLKDTFKEVKAPLCEVHCFTAVKKFNSNILERILPSDTYFRIWFYDISHLPQGIHNSEFEKCVNFEILMSVKNVKSDDKSLLHKKETSLCLSQHLPRELNIKGYLGDSKYLQKWGFHILDSFRIDETLLTGSTHVMNFEIKEYNLLRLIVFHGRIDTDLELFSDNVMIARSNSKNFEDVITIEIPPGNYSIHFKFFPPTGGFHKCEAIRMEFSMNAFHLIQENIDRMVARHKNKPNISKIDLFEHLNIQKELQMKRYTINIEPAFIMDKDDLNKYEASIVLAELSFVIEPEDSNKIELLANVTSDFLYLDANLYLTEIKSKKVISAIHKKNLNVLSTGLLGEGTYTLSLRYYRRLHYKAFNDSFKDVALFRADFAEFEFDSTFINRSKDIVNIITSNSYIKVKPLSNISHNWLCRHAGVSIPKSLNSLRYLEFNKDVHILDTFLIPVGIAKETIKFKLNFLPNMMLRVYVECHSLDIDIELYMYDKGERKKLADSKRNIHFETIMELVKDNTEYEIIIHFNESDTIKHNKCLTFKMEIGLEASHNYACPESPSYALLTDLKPIPEEIPSIDGIYVYDSRTKFLGEDKNSGYVYMLRRDNDEIIRYSEFTVTHSIDLKIEILNDFLQAPVNIMLTKKGGLEQTKEKYLLPSELAKNAFKPGKFNDAEIVAFGEIFENRTTLLVKNLPKGVYTVYIYIPGLKTKFYYESRVCSIYDIIVEIKKSKSHFKNKEIANIAEINDDNLEIPIKVPLTLNSYNYLESENYINLMDNFYVRRNDTNTDEIINDIEFELKDESICEFYVNQNILGDIADVSILGYTHYNSYSYAILKPGKYTASIKINKKPNDYEYESKFRLIRIYIGISPTRRVDEIYRYNNILSSEYQCKSMDINSIITKDHSHNNEKDNKHYHVETFTFNTIDIKENRIGEFIIPLKSNKNRIIVQIGGDFVLNKLNIDVTALNSNSSQNKWSTLWSHNIGDLDIIVPKGSYKFELNIDEQIILKNLNCVILALEVYILDLENYTNAPIFKLLKSHKNNIKPKCEGSVLPLELNSNTDIPYNRISDKGQYNLHLAKAHYFNNRQITKDLDNMNKINILVNEQSVIRVMTSVDQPNEMQIYPRLVQGSQVIQENLNLLSTNSKDRNLYWFIEKNDKNSTYILEFIEQQLEDLTEESVNYYCPSYGLDLFINTIREVKAKLECPVENNKILEYTLPLKQTDRNSSLPISEKGYHEKIEFSYFTERQYSENFVLSDSYKGLQYIINFSINGDYFLNLEFGYDHLVSIFDIYLATYNEDGWKVISTSEMYFNKADEVFPYKKIIQHNLEKGSYSIIILETMWNDFNLGLNGISNFDVPLCVPFSYSVDIVPLGLKNLPAEVVSVFPPGPISFKPYEEDLNMKIVLSKKPFTKKHAAITNSKNFMNIVNSFYFLKTPTGQTIAKDVKSEKVFPSKVSASEDSTEWYLMFTSDKFEINYDYKFNLDTNWIYDSNYISFKTSTNLKMPIIRIETDRESIFNFVDDIKGNDKLKKEEFKAQDKPRENFISSDLKKCGDHGKLIYDHMLNRETCTCFDGFSGKFCNICDGTIDKITNKCVVIDEDNNEMINTNKQTVTVNIANTNQVKEIESSQSIIPEETKPCPTCINGICDSKTGRCICEINFTGIQCEKKIEKSETKSFIKDEINNDSKTIIIKIGIGIVILLIIWYIYAMIRIKISNQIHNKKNEYNSLPTNEYEMSIGNNMNSINDLELVGDSQNLVDYEIRGNEKIKKGVLIDMNSL